MKFNPQPKPLKRTKSKPGFLKPVAEKKVTDKARYNKDSKAWLIGKRCACGCGRWANTTHHKRGREGYADIEKYFAGIKLLLDRDYWLPLFFDCHVKVENYPEWAYEKGYSETKEKNIYR